MIPRFDAFDKERTNEPTNERKSDPTLFLEFLEDQFYINFRKASFTCNFRKASFTSNFQCNLFLKYSKWKVVHKNIRTIKTQRGVPFEAFWCGKEAAGMGIFWV